LIDDVPLRRNRDFNLLWSGQVVSELGGRIAGVALPLLVLESTGSAAKAGIVGFASTIPLLVLTLPAGVLADRWDRKLMMIACDVTRCAAYATIVAAVAFGFLTYAQIVAVALINGIATVFFGIAERSALRSVVTPRQLHAALAQNQARGAVALLGGPPLGGVLFGIARSAPFLCNAASFFVSVVSLFFIRVPFQEERAVALERRLRREVVEGLGWFWRQPFIRTTALLVTGSDFVLNALYLAVIVLARQRGASPALIGVMFVFLGVSGLLGSVAAPFLARRVPTRLIVIATMGVVAALLPLLLVAPEAISIGLLYGAMFFLHPTWDSTVGAYRLMLTPDGMQGRVASIVWLMSFGSVPLGSLIVGFLLSGAGSTPTILVLTGIMVVVTLCALGSASVRSAPRRLSAEAAC
jgi:predicted MFS family arabinose efflux permease